METASLGETGPHVLGQEPRPRQAMAIHWAHPADFLMEVTLLKTRNRLASEGPAEVQLHRTEELLGINQ